MTHASPRLDTGVSVTELTDMTAINEAASLLDGVWSAPGLMPANLIRAIESAGGYVSAAYLGGRMVGASVAFRGAVTDRGRERPTLHSHITGVIEPSHGVGSALKDHQLVWARQRGIELITWTFDPLVSRNAYFNLHKLGAHCRRYHVDHYGPMNDGINAGDETDRLEAWWPVDVDDRPTPAGDDEPVAVVLTVGSDGLPAAGPATSPGDGAVGIQVPRDIEGIRRRNPDAAATWRSAVRNHMSPLMAEDHWITGMRRDGTYLLTRRGR